MLDKDRRKLLIIGNGFDLSCGLKSTFKNYLGIYNDDSSILYDINEHASSDTIGKDKNLTDFENKNKCFWKNRRTILYDYIVRIKNSTNKIIDFAKNNDYYNPALFECYILLRELNCVQQIPWKPNYGNLLPDFYNESKFNIDPKLNDFINCLDSFNFIEFLLILNSIYGVYNISTWSDVEKMISNMVNNDDKSLVTLNKLDYFIDFIKESINNKIYAKVPLNNKDPHSFIGAFFTSDDRLFGYYPVTLIFMTKFLGFDIKKDRLIDFFHVQLKKFENSFGRYIIKDKNSHDQNSSKNYDFESKKLLRKLLGDNFNGGYYLLNFNYTLPNSYGLNEIYSRNIHGKANEANLKNNIIIGIDNNNVPSDDYYDIFEFTKTYRVMTNSDRIVSERVLSHDVNDVIFFGHSLSDADYSYFQSIFDYLNIYDNDISLTFYYCIYNEHDRTKIKKESYKNVYNLINKYGESFENKIRGRNLLHKMLIENRLAICNVNNKSPKKN